MANINIPTSVIPGIKAIGLLSGKEFELLMEKIREFPKGALMDDLANSFQSFIELETASSIAEAIYSFGYLLVRNDNDDGQLANNLADSFLKATKEDDVSQDLSEILIERLHGILLLSDFLIPTFEAYRVVWEGNSVFRNSEVTTEIILLNDKSYSLPASGMVLNRLNLNIRLNNDAEEKYSIVLDIDDLEKLKSQIEVTIRETEEMKRSYSQFVNFIKL